MNAKANICRPTGDRAMKVRLLKVPAVRNTKELDQTSEGQGLVEYALILFLVSVASVGALTALGVGVKDQLYGVILATLPF
jgi:Flp pilus assembly pilin Flp